MKLCTVGCTADRRARALGRPEARFPIVPWRWHGRCIATATLRGTKAGSMQIQVQGAADAATGRARGLRPGGPFLRARSIAWRKPPHGQLIRVAARRAGAGRAGPTRAGRPKPSSTTRASPSPSTATATRSTASCRSTSSRASSPPSDWARDRGRRAPARADPQPVPRRHLRPAEGAQGRVDPGRAGARQRQLPAGDAGPEAAARHLHPHQRHRPRARRRRPVPGARGQRPLARRACPTWSRTGT